MTKNKLILSAAGSGKTTFLVKLALEHEKNKKILITTYTNENEEEIKQKITKLMKCIPSNITVQSWFSFLIQQGVKPYQGSMDESLFSLRINGMYLCNTQSGIKKGKNGRVYTIGESDVLNHYFTKDHRIYSDKISKFIVKCNEKENGKLISRISKIYSYIYIDEVQDLAGYDLELLKLFFSSKSDIVLVGDPRQVTYVTNHLKKNEKYNQGKIKDFLLNECKKTLNEIDIDETTLNKSHRNNSIICKYSSKLFPEYQETFPCECDSCRNIIKEHQGVFLIRENDIHNYLLKFNPIQLVWNSCSKFNKNFSHLNMGKAKGKTYERVLIYPTEQMRLWIKDNTYDFVKTVNGKKKKSEYVKEKFYVALTRAKYSVAIVMNFVDDDKFSDIEKYIP